MELYSTVVNKYNSYEIIGIYDNLDIAKLILKNNFKERIGGDGYYEYLDIQYMIYKHELNNTDVCYNGKYSDSYDNLVFKVTLTDDYFNKIIKINKDKVDIDEGSENDEEFIKLVNETFN